MNVNAPPKRTFSLLTEPWIPIAGVGLVSLNDVFTHPEFTRLGGTPIEKVVLLRLLLCVAHASSPVPDVDAWTALPPEKLASNALAYLSKWSDRFDLYDETHPFLQFPQLKGLQGIPSNPNALSLSVASGNKTILTQWSLGTEPTDAELARQILCGSGYGMGGGKYDLNLKVDPNVQKRKKATGKASAPQGTLTGYYGFLHSFMLGNTLWETLRLNLLTDEDRKTGVCPALGRPFWESMPAGETDEAYKSSYMGTLFPMDKFFCLNDGKIFMTQGISYPTHKNGQWDPGIAIYGDPKDLKARWCKPEQAPWRQLPSLLQFLDSTISSNPMPAFVYYGLPKLNESPETTAFGLWVGGVAVNTNSGEQYVSGQNDYVNSEFLIPMDWRGANSFLVFKTFMEEIENYSSILYKTVNKYYDEQSGESGKIEKPGSAATGLFWEKMEPLAQSIIFLSEEDDPENSEKVKAAKLEWKKIARSCYDDFCPCLTPRQMQAYIQCVPYFGPKKEQKKGGKK